MKTSTPESLPRSVPALLTDRTFGPFFVGMLASNVGTWVQNVGAAIVVFRLTGSTMWVGVVSVVQFAAPVLLVTLTGAAADRFDRRRLLIITQCSAAVAAGGLGLWIALVGLDRLPGVWPVLAATLMIGVAIAFTAPALHALLPSLVPRADLGQAIALNSATFNIGRALGPAVGSALIVGFGAAAVFGFNALTFGVLVIALSFITPRPRDVRHDGDPRPLAGFRYVKSDPTLLVLLVGVAGLGFGSDPAITLMPGLAERLLPADASVAEADLLVGVLSSSFGLGAVAASALLGRLRRSVEDLSLATAGLLTLAGAMASVAVLQRETSAIVALFVAGSGYLVAVAALTTLIQFRVHDEVRGRVMAIWGVAFLGSRPAAALLNGTVASMWSIDVAFVVSGGLVLTVALLLGTWTRRMKAAPTTLDRSLT